MDDYGVDVPSEPTDNDANANNGHDARGAKRRHGGADCAKTRVKARVDVSDMLMSSKLKQP